MDGWILRVCEFPEPPDASCRTEVVKNSNCSFFRKLSTQPFPFKRSFCVEIGGACRGLSGEQSQPAKVGPIHPPDVDVPLRRPPTIAPGWPPVSLPGRTRDTRFVTPKRIMVIPPLTTLVMNGFHSKGNNKHGREKVPKPKVS